MRRKKRFPKKRRKRRKKKDVKCGALLVGFKSLVKKKEACLNIYLGYVLEFLSANDIGRLVLKTKSMKLWKNIKFNAQFVFMKDLNLKSLTANLTNKKLNEIEIFIENEEGTVINTISFGDRDYSFLYPDDYSKTDVFERTEKELSECYDLYFTKYSGGYVEKQVRTTYSIRQKKNLCQDVH